MLLTACATPEPVTRAPQAPAPEVATDHAVLETTTGVSFVSLDDKEIPSYAYKTERITVQPRRRPVRVSYRTSQVTAGYRYSSTRASLSLTFQAEPGKRYRVIGVGGGDRWQAWIESAETGEVVAGRRP